MARNRKHEPAAIRFGPTLKALLLCLLIGGAGVGYVWQKDQIYQLGRQIKQREVRLRELGDQNEKLKKQLSTMRSPRLLEMRIRELNLGLVQPEQAQIWQLPEPSREMPGPSAGQQYAARAMRPANVP
jgi:cell division protein FtsB